MRKFLLQFITFLCLFFGAWFLLSRINFTGNVDFKKISKSNEEKIGNSILDFLKKTNDVVESDSITLAVNRMKNRLCKYNQLDSTLITIYVMANDEANAFALPGNNMVIYTGIMELCKTPEELCSVMAHEMVHIEHRHMIKKLTKEVGISLLITLASGESNAEILKGITKTITSTAFDRDLERDADETGVQYLAKANIDPEHFANILFRLSQTNDTPKNLEWISTHPNTNDRTADILKLRHKTPFKVLPLLDSISWSNIRKIAKNIDTQD
jgi:beta-barrel assembly-enhancing protease